MKKIITFIFVCLIGFGSLFMSSCGAKFKLNFIVDDQVYETIKTNGGKNIELPEDPEKTGYVFEGWYWDEDIWQEPFTASSLLNVPLTSDMNVYAYFTSLDSLQGTDLSIEGAIKDTNDSVGTYFYLEVPHSKIVLSLNDIVSTHPHSTWTLTSDLSGNNVINSKTISLQVGDNPLYYIQVTDKHGRQDQYILLVRRHEMYTVTFNSNGGSSCSSLEVEEDSYLTSIPTPSKTGYTFTGWDYDFNNPITSNVYTYATYSPNPYVVYLDPNNGYVTSNEVNVTYGSYYSLPIPTRTGYSFNGWYINENSNLSTTGVWTKDYDVNVYAKWTANSYDVSYDLDGGTPLSILPTKFTYDSELTIPNLTKTGYTFLGWYTADPNDAVLDYTISSTNIGDVKLYAKFVANDYNITYNPNNGNLDEVNQGVIYDDYVTLKTPTRDGYEFAGWYYNGSLVTNGNYKYDHDITLNASWKLIDYKITYQLNGGTNSSNNPSKYNIETEAFYLEEPTKTGYTFTGWTTPTDSTLKEEVCIDKSTGDLVFIANWKKNIYTINFDINTNDLENPTSIKVDYQDNFVLPIPSRLGYDFLGWYNGQYLISSGSYNYDYDLSITAKWNIQNYNIIYNLDGGVNAPSNPTKYNIESDEIVLSRPTRDGYEFIGWTTSTSSELVLDYVIPSNSTGHISLNANWKAIEYEVTLDVNTGDELEEDLYLFAYGDTVTLPTPTKTGYTFQGWYLNGNKFTSSTWNVSEDSILVARWTPTMYTITLTNGTNSKTEYVDYNSYFTLPIINKTGYTFEGYYSLPNGEGEQICDNKGMSLDKYLLADNCTLYAHYSYVVTFVTNGGEVVNPVRLEIDEYLSEDVVCVKDNRTFEGWYYDKALTRKVDYDKAIGTVTLYAKWVEELTPEQLVYSTSTSGITITGNKNVTTTLIIPSHIGGTPVIKIGDEAFKNLSSVTIVDVPNTVTYIGAKAFYGLNSLETITLPFIGRENGLTTGSSSVFGYIFGSSSSSSTSTITQYYLYNSSKSYTYYYIPKTIRNVTVTVQTAFPYGSFSNCEFIEHITIPEETTSIGSYAFYNCLTLQTLNGEEVGVFNIPNNVKVIKDYAFYNCDVLENVVIAKDVTYIGDYAFYGCNAITKFNTDKDYYINIPDTCTTIGQYAFAYLYPIKEVYIPDSVTYIGEGVFRNFTSLETITLPFIGRENGLTSGLSSVFGYIFGTYSSATTSTTTQYYSTGSDTSYNYYFIPETLRNVTVTLQTEFPYGSFSNCKLIENIRIPEETTSLGAYAFYNCQSLQTLNNEEEGRVNLPSNVLAINSYTFYNCNKITKFNSDELYTLNVHEGTTYINPYAFYGLKAIKEVYIPESVTYIGEFSFYGFNSLETITLPFIGRENGLTSGSASVFGYIFGSAGSSNNSTITQYYLYNSSKSYTYYYIPTTIRNVTVTVQTAFPYGSFSNCSNIEHITIPEETNSIGSYAFYNCLTLQTLNGEEVGVFNIPNNVKIINSYAFYNCDVLENVVIAKDVTYIGDSAFSGCDNIIRFNTDKDYYINIPDTCTTIGSYAFEYLSDIQEVYVPESVTFIGEGAFFNFGSLETITLPFIGRENGLTSGLSSVFGYIFGTHSSSTSTTTTQYYLYNSSESYTFYYIPKNLRNVTVTLQTEFPYGSFSNCSNIEHITIPEETTSIGAYAFYKCSGLLTLNSEEEGRVNLPSNVLAIGSYAFYNCSNIVKFNSDKLFTLNIHEGTTYINPYAFYGLKAIKEVYIPESVTYIGEFSFYGLNTLESITLPFIGRENGITTGSASVFGYIFGSTSSSTSTTTQYYLYNSSKSYTYYYIPKTIRNVTVTIQTVFPYGSFSNCEFIEHITIPEETDSIGSYAFYNCPALQTLNSEEVGVFNIPNKVKIINSYAFYNCDVLENVVIAKDVTYIGDSAFRGCNAITKFNTDKDYYINIPDTCTTIGQYAFAFLYPIKEVYVPECVTFIGESAFYELKALETITIPFIGRENGLTSGLSSVFGYIFGTNTSSSTSTTTQYYSTGSGTSYTYYFIPKTLRNVTVTVQTVFPYGSFYNCSFITSITLLENSDTSAKNCFYNCSAKVSKVLEKTVLAPWDGKEVSSSFNSGEGTIDNPYVILHESEYAYLVSLVNNGNSFDNTYFVLGSNLDINGYSLSLGQNADTPFNGVLDGKGYYISNITISSVSSTYSTDYAGAIGYLNGSLTNIKFTNLKINVTSEADNAYVGAIGYINSSAVVDNIHTTGSIKAQGTTSVFVGGLAGLSRANVSNSSSTCNVTSISTNYIAYAGGLFGDVSSCTLFNLYARGNVSAKGATLNYSRNGGLIGNKIVGITITDCYRDSKQVLTRFSTENSYFTDYGIVKDF